MAKFLARLVRTRDIEDKWGENPFQDITEENLNRKDHTIQNVCIIGRKESLNGYTYMDNALVKLSQLVEGARFFIDHPSKSLSKETDGVRPMSTWAGVFTQPRKEGDKIFADLKVRPAWWDLVEDVSRMRPQGVGCSINSTVRVYKDEQGKESVIDIEKLKSVDLVSQAATTMDLFQHLPDVSADDESEDEARFIQEGVLKDKMKERKVEQAINDLQYEVIDMIRDIFRSKDRPFPDKKKDISALLDDLDSEVNNLMTGKAKSTSDSRGGLMVESDKNTKEVKNDMELKDITLEILSKERSDLVDQIRASIEDADRVSTMEDELKELKAKIDTFTATNDILKKENEDLKKEKDDLTKKLDEYETKDKAIAKEALITQAITEAKLPKEAISDVFRSDLMKKDEKEIKEAVEDRKTLWFNGKRTPVKNAGGEFKEKRESQVDNKEEDDKLDSARKKFESTLKD